MSPRAAWRLESLGFGPVYEYGPGKLDWMAAGLPFEGRNADRPRAGTVARADVPTCRMEERVGEVRPRIREAGWDMCVVVNEENVVLGIVRGPQVDEEADATVERAMRPGPSTFRPHVPIEEMASYMLRHDMPDATVTTSDGRLVGQLVRDDAVREAHALHAGGEGGHDHA